MITSENATWHLDDKWSAFASDLGWPPGNWPRKVETNLGNGKPFLMLGMTGDGALYRQTNGYTMLQVFND